MVHSGCNCVLLPPALSLQDGGWQKTADSHCEGEGVFSIVGGGIKYKSYVIEYNIKISHCLTRVSKVQCSAWVMSSADKILIRIPFFF